MSQSLPTLGQCCRSVAVLDDVMARLAFLQGYFDLLGRAEPAAAVNGAARILAGAWSDVRDIRNLLAARTETPEADHA